MAKTIQNQLRISDRIKNNLPLLLLGCIFIVVFAAWTHIHGEEKGTVMKVIDGDTIVLDNGEVVRYIGIDTPEISVPVTALECYGPEATDKNKELVEGKQVRLARDIKNRDRYGRLLRYVYVDNSDIFVNLDLVKEGYARTLKIYPNISYAQEIEMAVAGAQAEHKGMWLEETCSTKS